MGLAANNRYIGEAPKFMDQRVLQSGIDITNFGPKPVAFPIRNKESGMMLDPHFKKSPI